MESKALGKGLSALIVGKEGSERGELVRVVNIGEIKNSRVQPRTNYDAEKLEELKASIKEKGVLQPIIVRESTTGFEVVAGERRLRAARELNLKDVPVIVKNVSDEEALVIALVENIQREELNPIEEAEAFRRLIEDFRFTQESVAQSVGKDRSTISNLLRLLKLPDEIKKSVYAGNISMGHARALLGVESLSEQTRFFEQTVKKGLSVRELESLVKSSEKRLSRREKILAPKGRDVVTLEEGLQKLLGTKVRIDIRKKRGKITIDFYSPEDLNRIVKLIIK